MNNNKRDWLRPIRLKNGFYIEIFNKGVQKGMKIRNETKKAMEEAAVMYATFKRVVILGEYKNGVPFIEIPYSY